MSRRSHESWPEEGTAEEHVAFVRSDGEFNLQVHHEMFVFVLGILEKASLLHGQYSGIDASTMEANAAMKSIVRLAEESGIETPSKAELIAFDRTRQGRKTSNKDWQSTTDEEARIGKLKDGRTHMAYKPEHVVDLESGAIVSAVIHLRIRATPQHLPPHSRMPRPSCAR